jgi:hypothetical protein
MRRNSIAAIRIKAIVRATDRRKPLSSAVMQKCLPKTTAGAGFAAPIFRFVRCPTI